MANLCVFSSLHAVFENKKAIVITPTISLMQDQVANLEEKGIKAVYLSSAQLDFGVEDHALSLGSDVNLIFVTPEWISKSEKQAKLHELVDHSKITLIAIDEAHLYISSVVRISHCLWRLRAVKN